MTEIDPLIAVQDPDAPPCPYCGVTLSDCAVSGRPTAWDKSYYCCGCDVFFDKTTMKITGGEGRAKAMKRKRKSVAKDDVVIKTLPQVAGSHLLPIMAAGWAEMEAAGFPCHNCPWNWDSKVIFAEVDGAVVGFIAWKLIAWQSCGWIDFGYVLPAFRRKGIYRQMFESLVAVGKAEGWRTIGGATDTKNVAMQRAAEALNRKAVTITYEYDLRELDGQAGIQATRAK